ncbi:MAG: Hpt domain-containing response regulator [Agriterribacter sp.]
MSEKPLKNVSILLVEDNEMNTLLASSIIERTGASITEADNGKAAIDLLQKKSFDIILMDLNMPGMNGFETTRHIRENLGLAIPIIAITANVINDEEKRCLEAGMNGFISKPYTEKALLDKMAALLSTLQPTDTGNTDVAPANDSGLYDLTLLKEITKGNHSLLQRMLRVFCDQVPAVIQELKAAYTAKSFKQVSELAHSIKANIDSLGISSLKETIRQIESTAATGAPGAELGGLIAKLEATTDVVVMQLQSNELS